MRYAFSLVREENLTHERRYLIGFSTWTTGVGGLGRGSRLDVMVILSRAGCLGYTRLIGSNQANEVMSFDEPAVALSQERV